MSGGGNALARELDGLEAYLVPGNDPLELARMIVSDTWRETAAGLRKLFHPTPDEVRQLEELAASLHRKAGGVQ